MCIFSDGGGGVCISSDGGGGVCIFSDGDGGVCIFSDILWCFLASSLNRLGKNK